MEEIIFVNKPKGITSFGVIKILRQKTGLKKIGHAGTLDPLASGLLIVGLGQGTKRLKEFEALPKTYLMDILFGVKTETGDLEGKIVAEKKVNKEELEELEKVLKEIEGKIKLPVPLYSAIKIKGKPLYKYARQGIKIKAPLKEMEIIRLRLIDVYGDKSQMVAKVEMECGKGTYARSVAEEIGKRLGLPATLKDLVRTKIGKYTLSKAKQLDEIN